MTSETSEVWPALVKWKRAREAFQAKATHDTTYAYCAAVETLERLVLAHEAEQVQKAEEILLVGRMI